MPQVLTHLLLRRQMKNFKWEMENVFSFFF